MVLANRPPEDPSQQPQEPNPHPEFRGRSGPFPGLSRSEHPAALPGPVQNDSSGQLSEKTEIKKKISGVTPSVSMTRPLNKEQPSRVDLA